MQLKLIIIFALGIAFWLNSRALTQLYYRLTAYPKTNLSLDIAFTQWQILEDVAKAAIEKGILLNQDNQDVTATLNYQNQSLPVQLRLKGDSLNPIKTSRWSFRVETDSDQKPLGMSRFSLQAPETRNFINQWLFLQTLGQEDLIALRYDFVALSINGERKGVYALEESFGKEVIEANKRREGPILKFNEDDYWQAMVKDSQTQLTQYYATSLIEATKNNQTTPDPSQVSLEEKALAKMTAYRQGNLKPSQVFDYDDWSAFLALSDILGARQGLLWYNLRFYFNPITGLFEPIAFNGKVGKTINSLSINLDEPGPLLPLITDPDFIKVYFNKLASFSSPEYLSLKFNSFNRQINQYQKLLKQDYPDYSFDQNNFLANADFARQSLSQINLPQLFQSADGLTTALTNFVSFNAALNEYQILPGFHQLDRLLIIPPTSKLVITSGTRLNLVNGGGIISYSPVKISGTADNPAVISSSDGLGGGLLVIKAGEPSLIEHALFDHLTVMPQSDYSTTGAVTFYQSDLTINHSLFSNNASEDSLNIIRSNFVINNSNFEKTFSDAIDVDFGDGEINQSNFTNIGNDAIDFSGSIGKVNQVTINQTGDKGISVGEKSQAIIDSASFANLNLAIASKDLSEVESNRLEFNNVNVGVAAYQKKPEFGPAKVTQKIYVTTGLKTPYEIETNSLLLLPHGEIKGDKNNLAEKYQ